MDLDYNIVRTEQQDHNYRLYSVPCTIHRLKYLHLRLQLLH